MRFSFWAAAQQHVLLVRGCRPEMNDTQLAITVGPGCLARLNLVDRSAKEGTEYMGTHVLGASRDGGTLRVQQLTR